MNNKENKYDITKYLRKGTVEYKNNQKDLNNLDKLYEIEELLEETWKESGENEDNWAEITGFKDYVEENNENKSWKTGERNNRKYGCFLGQIRQVIEKLGGKLYKDRGGSNDNQKQNKENNDNIEREREREQNLFFLPTIA